MSITNNDIPIFYKKEVLLVQTEDVIYYGLEGAKKLSEKLYRHPGYDVIGTGGCFDIIHRGHIYLLEEAKKLGINLIVFINSDTSFEIVKHRKPYNRYREYIIAALRPTNYVVVFDEETPCEAIKIIKPALWVKGYEYYGKTIPEMQVMRAEKIRYIPREFELSTTKIVNRIREESNANTSS